MFKVSMYYRIRIIRALLVLIFSLTVTFLTLNSVTPAISEANRFAAESAIYIETDTENAKTIGTNLFSPLKLRLAIDGENLESEYQIENGSLILPIMKSTTSYFVEGSLNISEPTSISSIDSNYSQPLPVLIKDNLNLGKITFEYGSTRFTNGASKTLENIISNIMTSNMHGIYLVGTADKTGSDKANLKLSDKRVKLVAKLVKQKLNEMNYKDFVIYSENMSNYLANGQNGIRNESDRSVTFMIYPTN